MHTAPGSFFTSVALESANAGVLPLRELQPYHWPRAYPPETLERYGEPNEQRRPKNTKTSFYCAAGAVKSTGKAAPA